MKTLLVIVTVILLSGCRQDKEPEIGTVYGVNSVINNFMNATLKYNNNTYECVGYINGEQKKDITLMCKSK